MFAQKRSLWMLVVPLFIGLATTGCNINLEDIDDFLDELEEIELNINNEVAVIQDDDPRTIALPTDAVNRGDTIIINNNVTVIGDVSEDLVYQELPDITLVGFENLTGYDIYIRYAVDGEVQGILVFDGETLLLEYPCLFELELLDEEDFDPVTGLFVDAYDLSGTFFENGFDFECGDALIITIDAFAVEATAERIDLLP